MPLSKNIEQKGNHKDDGAHDRRWACPGFYRMPPAVDGGICRIKLSLGMLTTRQMRALSAASTLYSNGQIELTTRANIQLRAVQKINESNLINHLIAANLGPLTPEGDDIRNVMIASTAGIDHNMLIDTTHIAQQLLELLQNSPEYRKLSPKFSFLINGGENTAIYDHNNDLWLDATAHGDVFAFGFASCPSPNSDKNVLGYIHEKDALNFIIVCLDSFIQFQKLYPTVTRMKHIVEMDGLQKYLNIIKSRFAINSRIDHTIKIQQKQSLIGVFNQKQKDVYYLGVRPLLGRITADQMALIADLIEKRKHNTPIRLTHHQGLVIPFCVAFEASEMKKQFTDLGFATDADDAKAHIFCCAGAPGCKSAHSNVQQDALKLIGEINDKYMPNIHLTGCGKSCAATKPMPFTLVAVEDGYYELYQADNTRPNDLGRLLAAHSTIHDAANVIATITQKGH